MATAKWFKWQPAPGEEPVEDFHFQNLFIIGEVDGVKVVHDSEPRDTQGDYTRENLVRIAGLYVAAARAIDPNFSGKILNASYALDNLAYLYREYDETGDLYRVFVPFSNDGDASIADARSIADFRALLRAEGEGEQNFDSLPEPVRLLLEEAESRVEEY